MTVYARRGGRVVTSLRSPRGTAFEPNLYSLENAAPGRRHIIESAFMTCQIDTVAAGVVAKILSGQFVSLTNEERSHFARFLLSLRARHPDAIDLVRTRGREELLAALRRDPQDYLALKSPSMPSTLVEFVEQRAPGLIENFGMINLPGLIANDTVAERLYRITCWTHEVRHASVDLLLSDRPCVLDGSLVTGACLLALPLSPTTIFFACSDPVKNATLRNQPATKLVKALNVSSVSQARERVYGANAHHLPFVERYLRR